MPRKAKEESKETPNGKAQSKAPLKKIRKAKPLGGRPADVSLPAPAGRRPQETAPPPQAAQIPLPAKPKRERGPLSRLVAAIGNGLYSVGFSAELLVRRMGRIIRMAGAFVWQLAGWFLLRIGRSVGGLLRDFGWGAMAPFRHFRRRRAQLRRVRRLAERRVAALRTAPGKRHLFGMRVANTTRLLAHIAVGLMPLLAAAVLTVTIGQVLGMNYMLAVEVNGQTLGYVTDQTVVENAKVLLRERIRLAPNQELTDWQLNPEYTIAGANELVTTQQLVNGILMNSSGAGNDIVEATGLYINNTLYAVTVEGERLKLYLDSLLARQELPGQPGAVVRFRRSVVCEPNNGDVYFASSVQAYDELIERLARNVQPEVTYTSAEGETYGDIAYENGITFEQLQSRNAQVMEGATEQGVPEEGTVFLIKRAQAFLQVETRYREKTLEPLPYAVLEEDNPEMAEGSRRVVQVGVDGEMEVWEDYVLVDGELVERIPVPELTRILTDPVDQIVQVGTREVIMIPGASGSVGPGGWYFPVPESTYSSRGYSPGGHRGFDINAGEGSAILAASSGTVITAGWHYSFGNYVEIDHGNGLTSLYAHCSALYVAVGETVSGGQTIAAVGSTGNSSGNHLHLEVSVNGALTDPELYVGYPY